MSDPRLKQNYRKQLLTARVLLEREQLRHDTRKLGQSISPESIKNAILDSGSQTLMSLTRRRSGLFSLIEKNPYISLGVARFLLRASKTRSALLKPLALAATSWYVYNKFRDKSKRGGKSQDMTRGYSEEDIPVDHGSFTYQDQDPATDHRRGA